MAAAGEDSEVTSLEQTINEEVTRRRCRALAPACAFRRLAASRRACPSGQLRHRRLRPAARPPNPWAS
eukprot:scaffold19440_cov99-Isochrysis_galbana.AAC.2